MNNELMFIGMNIPKETEKMVNEQEKVITNGMNENELKAYLLGVQNTLSALSTLVESNEQNEFITHVNIDIITEFDIKDLIKLTEE